MIFIILMDSSFRADIFGKGIAVKNSFIIKAEFFFCFGVGHHNGLGFCHTFAVKKYAFILAETIKSGVFDSLLLLSGFRYYVFIYKLRTIAHAVCYIRCEISYFVIIGKWFGIMKHSEFPKLIFIC